MAPKRLTTEEVEYFHDLILEFGEDKGGMRYVNKELLKAHGLEDTKENREYIRDRYKTSNPSSTQCTEKKKMLLKSERR